MKWMSMIFFLLCSAGLTAQDFIIDPIVEEVPVEVGQQFFQQVSVEFHPGDQKVKIEWTTGPSFVNQRFFVERSLDGEVFTIISEFPGRTAANAPQQYEFIDGMVENGKVYIYRLASLGTDRQVVYHPGVITTRPLSGISEVKH